LFAGAVSSHLPIWCTPWIPTIPDFRPSPKFPNNRNQASFLISDFINPVTSSWNLPMLNAIFDASSVQEILKVRISQESKPHYIWTPACSGKYSTGSAYLQILKAENSASLSFAPAGIWKSIWKLNLNDRLRLFLWKIAWNILPTQARLAYILPYYYFGYLSSM
jgi:hypothetical protein